MKYVHPTSIALDEETYQIVKHLTGKLGISMNELISVLLHLHANDEVNIAFSKFMQVARPQD